MALGLRSLRAPRTELTRAPSTVRRVPGAVDVLWTLRHLRELDQVDWSEASYDPTLIAILDRAFAGLYEHYFRVEVEGLDGIPPGPVLLVGNHSGFGVAELLMLLIAWHRHFGGARPVHALAHRWLYETPFLRVVVPKIGGVRATWQNACDTLGRGPLAVFPGGEHESTRPFSERYRVDLAGHRGFARLALAKDVPIVPFVTIGSHATMILPPGMRTLASVTGARRYLGLEAVPLPMQVLAWILGGLAVERDLISTSAYLLLLLMTPPLYPSKIVTRFGRTIRAGEVGGVDAVYAHVASVMQGMMDDLAARRRSVFH